MTGKAISNELDSQGALSRLSPEIVSLILDFCGLEDLRQILATCKSLHQYAALAVEFRQVDLSSHNLGWLTLTSWNGETQRCRADQYPPIFDVEGLTRRQHAFLGKVLDRPYFGRLVHEFTWTIRSYCDTDGLMPGNMMSDAIYPDTHLWQAFRTFTNVTKLDLACYHTAWDWVYLRQPPKVLFPAVVDLRLSGVMYRQIVETIFQSIDVSNLESLAIDNLQDPGHSGDIYPYHHDRRWYSKPKPQDTETVTVAGTMRGILPKLQGQCTSLVSLIYRKAGWVFKNRMRSQTQDAQCYEELGVFLESVSKTLRTLCFEQGLPPGLLKSLQEGTLEDLRTCVPRPAQKLRPMDESFLQHILPVLMTQKWPTLEVLELIGVGSWKGKPAMDNLKKARLRKHLGSEVCIEYQEVSDVPCEEYDGKYCT